MNLQKWQQENDMLLTPKITQNMVKEMKMIQALNLRQKLSNQIFVIIVIIQIHIFM